VKMVNWALGLILLIIIGHRLFNSGTHRLVRPLTFVLS